MTNSEFYNSAKWQRLRVVALRRDGYMCQYAKAEGKTVPANTVHHIFPRDAYPEYQWQLWNLISLSNEAHNMMHNRFDGSLSELGEKYKQALAASRGIKILRKGEYMVTLVCGLRGTGKTTYVRKNLGDGLCYDLDAIANAFRLSREEYHSRARKMANDFLPGFLYAVKDYTEHTFIIRTAPTIKEVEQISPDEIVFCQKIYVSRKMDDIESAKKRIEDIRGWAEENNVRVLEA